MELRHLRYFRELGRTLSFSRAAENLHIAQPPLSRQIQQLEALLAVKLIQRTRPLALTEAGQHLYQHLDPLFAQLENLIAETRNIAGHRQTSLTIGFAPSVLFGELPDVIRALHSDGNTRVAMQEMVTVAQINALKTGQIDIGLGRISLTDPEIEQQVIVLEPLIAALPAPQPRRATTLAALSQWPQILYPAQPRPGYADHVLGLFRQHNLQPGDIHWASDMQTALGMAAAGLGVTLVPAAARQIQRTGLHYRKITDAAATSPIILSHRKGDDSPALHRCIALLTRQYPPNR
ncbi:LysR family transcriptional regulator [Shimwellia pseudoproteus]|uniref:LysR family transcriptional regulator n=1 Tax=Shimwellia pseudoproteus TaxID=570012 RepID=UPI0018ED4E44|nr:LysR family transcriptional regulator [Shimwellia pseudoproteus]MBJ3815831.1 LysR family transcriptional regulator [Shimwellia pseudoproteus]